MIPDSKRESTSRKRRSNPSNDENRNEPATKLLRIRGSDTSGASSSGSEPNTPTVVESPLTPPGPGLTELSSANLSDEVPDINRDRENQDDNIVPEVAIIDDIVQGTRLSLNSANRLDLDPANQQNRLNANESNDHDDDHNQNNQIQNIDRSINIDIIDRPRQESDQTPAADLLPTFDRSENDIEEEDHEEEEDDDLHCEPVLSPEPSQEEIEAKKSAIDQLEKIEHYQLLKCIDETAQIYDCLDLLQGDFVTARRLEKPKHKRRLSLALRLAINVDTDETRQLYELLIPEKTTFLLYLEKSIDNDSTLHYWWFEPPNHGSLHTYVIERKRLPELQSKDYFKQICHLVDFCHQRGVVIRDLKLRKFVFADARRQIVKLDDLDETAICPENKIDPESIDFETFDQDDDRLCDRHGCPAYVSPEILDLSKKWYSGKAADVWSLGVLLYVLLVGRYPFYDVTPAGLFTKIRQARIHLSDQDGVRLEARLLVRSMLRRDPKERPSVADVLANPWLTPKDYRSAFKAFDCSDCVFWKTTNRPTIQQSTVAPAIATRQAPPTPQVNLAPTKYARNGSQGSS